MRTILVFLLLGIINTAAFNQAMVTTGGNQDVYVKKGDYYFGKKAFKKAIVYYNMAYQNDASNFYSVLRKAEAFEALNLYDQAVACYRIVFNSNAKVTNKQRLKYAFLLLKTKDIKNFEAQMKLYNKEVESEIHNYANSTEIRAKMYYDTTVFVVENESFINSEQSEISPVVHNNQLIFASDRKKLDGSNGNPYYNLFAADFLESGRLGKLNKYNKNINSEQNETSPAFNNSELFFTRNTASAPDVYSYKTKAPADVRSRVNIEEFSLVGFRSIGHIAFNSKATEMYFVSDALGGQGGLDIYKSKQVNGIWQKPVNLGSDINTPDDETYPWLVNDSLLYFSSKGHKGLGGFDLYYVNITKDKPEVKNLGGIVNTKYNDYSLSFTPGGLTGYFSSDRPGGLGKEDIYRMHAFKLKIKYPAYQFKQRPFIEDDKINLYLSDGEEYNIASDNNSGFSFTFKPEEPYKMVIQHENPLVQDAFDNAELTPEQRTKALLKPTPKERTEIPLQGGLRYQFAAGLTGISETYKQALNEASSEYQNNEKSTIDLTALAKELLMSDGEVYTIRFEKDPDRKPVSTDELSTLNINNNQVDVKSRSFFIVLPLDVEANFNIQTDIAYLKEKYKPKKVGVLKVDEAPVIKEKPVISWEGFPIVVNTENPDDATKEVLAREFAVIPGSFYILTLSKSYEGTDQKLEIVVPLTKGVKYNLGTTPSQEQLYSQSLSQLMKTQEETMVDDEEELIDISVLSKELDISPGDDIMFSLVPARKYGSSDATKNILTTLDIDGRKLYVPVQQKLKVKLKLEEKRSVNIQTDLNYIKENFDASTIALKVDTTAISENIKQEEKKIITDPVFDVIVVNFNKAQYNIRPDAKTILDSKVIKALKGDNRLYVTIKGYTDALGDAEYNKKLSGNRAMAVKDYLAANGIGENRIRTFSFGESMSLDNGVNWEDLSEDELQQHRKVEIVIYLPK